jgi:hypothetical protein
MRYSILIILVFFISCNAVNLNEEEKNNLKIDLKKMVKTDQIAANNASPPKQYKHLSKEKWLLFQDSVYTNHKIRIEKIFDRLGFLGFDKVGKEGSKDFWLLTQHSDKYPNFQKKVLKKMKIEVKNNNANPQNYAYLYDRVQLNIKKKQLYATQLEYNEIGQAIPKRLEDSVNIDFRRDKFKLENLKEYLNFMTQMHFEMNKQHFIDKGIIKPNFYK